MARVNGQRMGRGPAGCINMADWNHFFTPNSPSAIAARENCVDYWLRLDNSTPKKLKSVFSQSESSGSAVNFTKMLMILVVIALMYYFIKK